MLASRHSLLKGLVRKQHCIYFLASLTLFRHCADTVLSFTNQNTVKARVAGPLIDFTSQWVQSPSDYDFLIASSMKPEWAAVHKPVISRNGSHTLYTQFQMSQPNGKLVICHRMCGAELEMKIRKNNVVFQCPSCHSTCRTPKHKSDGRILLQRRGLTRVSYPQEQYLTEWKLPGQAEGGPTPAPGMQTLPGRAIPTEGPGNCLARSWQVNPF
jgi:hypothetical protein